MQTILRWPGIARCGTIIRSFRANMVPNWGLIGYDTSSGQPNSKGPGLVPFCFRKATARAHKEPTGSTSKLAHVRQPRTTVVNPA
jgi:hypothetical protein